MIDEAPVEHIKLLPYPLDTVDAALMFLFRDQFEIRYKRIEELPSKLVIYTVADEQRIHNIGVCGEIRVLFFGPCQARLSIEVYPCNDEDVIKFYNASNRETARMARANGDGEIRKGRKELLMSLCNRLRTDLEASGSVQPEIQKPSSGQAGKPALPLEEASLRIALALLEKRYKAQDSGMTRGEVVVLAREKLGILTTISNIKDGMRRLEDTKWKNDENLLAAAQERLYTWLAKLG